MDEVYIGEEGAKWRKRTYFFERWGVGTLGTLWLGGVAFIRFPFGFLIWAIFGSLFLANFLFSVWCRRMWAKAGDAYFDTIIRTR